MNPKWRKTIRTSIFRPWFYLAIVAISFSITILSAASEYLSSGNLPSNSANPKGVHKRPDSTQPVQLNWEQIRLRDGLDQLSKSSGVPILLDRRIDPDQRISLSSDHDPIIPTLKKLADKIGAADKQSSARSFILAHRRRPSGSRQSSSWQKDNFRAIDRLPIRDNGSTAGHWNGTTWPSPRELLERLTDAARLRRLPSGGPIPHDLWAANRLDGLSLIERFMAVLIQFDLTFEPVEQSGDVTPNSAGPDSRITIYDPPIYGRRGCRKKGARTWRNQFPEAGIRVVGRQIEVQTTAENHRRLLSNRPKRKNNAKLPADTVDLGRNED